MGRDAVDGAGHLGSEKPHGEHARRDREVQQHRRARMRQVACLSERPQVAQGVQLVGCRDAELQESRWNLLRGAGGGDEPRLLVESRRRSRDGVRLKET